MTAGPTRIALHQRVTTALGTPNVLMGTLRTGLTQIGGTPNFDFSYVDALGQKGAVLVDELKNGCEKDYLALKAIFGLTPKGLPFDVQLITGLAGGSHQTCRSTKIAISVNDDVTPTFAKSLLVMEVGEVFMANHPGRWQCDKSVGEGLSRVLADNLHPGMIAKFISSNSWLNTGTATTQRPNLLDNPKDDRDYEGIGCAVLLLNWLRFQLGHSWAEIVTAGGDPSAAYQKLTGKSTAWNDFSSFIDAQFPRGQQYHLTTDNPFPRPALVA